MVRQGIIDFTAFLDKDGQVIIKELSVIDVDSKCTQHWIFKPPTDQQQSMIFGANNRSFDYHNRWMSTHYHGLYYSNGTTLYESLPSSLDHTCHDIRILFAPTTEKAQILERLFNKQRAVISLELFGCPPLPRDILFGCRKNEEDGEEEETVGGGGGKSRMTLVTSVCFIKYTPLDSIALKAVCTC